MKLIVVFALKMAAHFSVKAQMMLTNDDDNHMNINVRRHVVNIRIHQMHVKSEPIKP